MAFGQNGQNNYQEKSMNTKSIQFYNNNGKNGSTLIPGFWNSFITLKISPVLPEGKRSDSKTYNYDTFINLVLSPEKAATLLMSVTEEIMPILKSGSYDFEDIGIPVGVGYVEISNGAKHGRNKETICLTLYNKVDSEGKTDEYLTYEFNKSAYYTGYTASTGSITKKLGEAEFFLFMEILTQSVKASTNAIAHSIRNAEKWRSDKQYENMKAIMQKLGLQVEAGNGGGRGGSKPTGFFSGSIQSNDGEGLNDNEVEYGELGYGDRLALD